MFFRKKPVASAEARVIRVKADGMVVFVPKFGIEAPVAFETTDEAPCALDEEAMTVTTPEGKTWKVFDALRVRVEIEELPARRSRLKVTVVPEDP